MSGGVYPVINGNIINDDDVNFAVGCSIVAGENITANNVVYIKYSDGKAYVSDTGTPDDIRANGIALETKSIGETLKILKTGVYTTSGLTANTTYYLGASGAITTTPSGVVIGQALTATQLLVNIVQDDRDIVGTIKPIAISLSGIPTNFLTAFWKACDGSVLSDTESPLNGVSLPALNSGTQRFLRGSTTSGATGGTETHNHQWAIDTADNDVCITVQGTGSARTTQSFDSAGNVDDIREYLSSTEMDGSYYTSKVGTLPSYYEVPFYIKIK